MPTTRSVRGRRDRPGRRRGVAGRVRVLRDGDEGGAAPDLRRSRSSRPTREKSMIEVARTDARSRDARMRDRQPDVAAGLRPRRRHAVPRPIGIRSCEPRGNRGRAEQRARSRRARSSPRCARPSHGWKEIEPRFARAAVFRRPRARVPGARSRLGTSADARSLAQALCERIDEVDGRSAVTYGQGLLALALGTGERPFAKRFVEILATLATSKQFWVRDVNRRGAREVEPAEDAGGSAYVRCTA